MLIKRNKKDEIVEKCRAYRMRDDVSTMSEVINEAMFLAEEELRDIYDLLIGETRKEFGSKGDTILRLLKQKIEKLEDENK